MCNEDSFERLSDGTLAEYTSLGCYPLLYLTKQNNILCPACARDDEENHGKGGDPDDPLEASDVNWEDASLYCDECSQRIESAYAEDDVGHSPDDTND